MTKFVLFQEDKIGLTLEKSDDAIYICVLRAKNQVIDLAKLYDCFP